MTAGTVEPELGLPHLAGDRWFAPARAFDRTFWQALGAAALLHMLLLIGAITTAPRHLGDASGSDDGISISVVTEADVQSRSTVGDEAQPPPGAVPTPPPQPQTRPPEAAQPPTPEVPLEIKKEVESEIQAETKPEPKAYAQSLMRPSLTEEAPDLLAVPDPSKVPAKKAEAQKEKEETKSEPKQQPQKPQKERTAKLDLSPAPSDFNASAGGAGRTTAGSRPPGITRSGANDDFGRRVVAELQKTMPQLRDTLGHVTVRIVLDQNGNVVEVKVIQPSNIAGLDQSVVFAVKQTNFPFPPPNATDIDRIFQIRYNYL
jgi:periplasmic protein TonB